MTTLCVDACIVQSGTNYYDGTSDSECDDGGSGAEYASCSLGSDCTDCGPRVTTLPPASPPTPPSPPLPPEAPPPSTPPPLPPEFDYCVDPLAQCVDPDHFCSDADDTSKAMLPLLAVLVLLGVVAAVFLYLRSRRAVG